MDVITGINVYGLVKIYSQLYSQYKERKINKKQLAEALEISRPTLDKLLKEKGF